MAADAAPDNTLRVTGTESFVNGFFTCPPNIKTRPCVLFLFYYYFGVFFFFFFILFSCFLSLPPVPAELKVSVDLKVKKTPRAATTFAGEDDKSVICDANRLNAAAFYLGGFRRRPSGSVPPGSTVVIVKNSLVYQSVTEFKN